MTCIAVIDVETTGKNRYRHDRIVEIAALVINSDGEILREFISLVNPERDKKDYRFILPSGIFR